MIPTRLYHHQNPFSFHIIEFSDEEESLSLSKRNCPSFRQITSNLSNITMVLGCIKTIKEPELATFAKFNRD